MLHSVQCCKSQEFGCLAPRALWHISPVAREQQEQRAFEDLAQRYGFRKSKNGDLVRDQSIPLPKLDPKQKGIIDDIDNANIAATKAKEICKQLETVLEKDSIPFDSLPTDTKAALASFDSKCFDPRIPLDSEIDKLKGNFNEQLLLLYKNKSPLPDPHKYDQLVLDCLKFKLQNKTLIKKSSLR